MKARVKATGEIVDVTQGIYSPYQYVDKDGTIYTEDHLEELSESGGVIFIDTTIDYWTRLEHQYAGLAMQGILSRSGYEIFEDLKMENWCVKVAHALVNKLKEE